MSVYRVPVMIEVNVNSQQEAEAKVDAFLDAAVANAHASEYDISQVYVDPNGAVKQVQS